MIDRAEYPLFKLSPVQHFRRRTIYLVNALVENQSDKGKVMVLYTAVTPNTDGTYDQHVRDYDEFYACLDPNSGTVVPREHPEAVPRFQYLGSASAKQS